MSIEVPVLLHTEDGELARRVQGHAGSRREIRHIPDPTTLRDLLRRHAHCLLLLDVREPQALTLLREVRHAGSGAQVLAFGNPRAEPSLEALSLGACIVLPIEFDGPTLVAIVEQASGRVALAAEAAVLRKRLDAESVLLAALQEAPAKARPLRQFFPPLRHFQDTERLLHGIIDGLADAAVVLRAGLYVREEREPAYRLRASIGCLNGAAIDFGADGPLARWLRINAQIVSRAGLDHVQDAEERLGLQQALDLLGAELIVPLQGRRRLSGWLFLGRRATGAPFSAADIQEIVVFAEHAATALENVLLYNDILVQKTFAETLLHSVPTGIVAAGADARVRWYNEAAERILTVPRSDVQDQPVETLGSRLSDLVRRALADGTPMAEEWTDRPSQRRLAARAIPLASSDGCLGAVTFIEDLTRERLLQRKQKELDRAAFWSDLSANLAHEIRNPLVAIKTFAQLLPERYGDEEFRIEFSKLMSHEVDRLNAIIEQINRFASHPAPVRQPLDVRDTIEEAVRLARFRVSGSAAEFETSVSSNLPPLAGDRAALAEGLAHAIVNALEALRDRPQPRIQITASATVLPGASAGVLIRITDNGPGIDSRLLPNVFSPFCTGKGVGLGLGLPLLERTITDHDGQVQIESSPRGTCVILTLPAEPAGQEPVA